MSAPGCPPKCDKWGKSQAGKVAGGGFGAFRLGGGVSLEQGVQIHEPAARWSATADTLAIVSKHKECQTLVWGGFDRREVEQILI